jgi:D-glycero-D-manno-heptose 1,7-bisphosphate phosphatase
VFIDRDGVIVEEVGYLHRVEDVRFIPGALEAIAQFNQAGIPVIEVTNQAGVARGYYGWDAFDAVQAFIDAELEKAGGWLDAAWACGCHPSGKGPLAMDHPCRKPNPGMLLEAAEALAIDLAESWMVGDKTIDIEAGIHAGVKTAILVETGYGARMREEVESRLEWPGRVIFRKSLADVVAIDSLR